MPDACVTAAINELHLLTTNSQYIHDAIKMFVVEIHRVLKSTYNPAKPSYGEMLLCSSTDANNPSARSEIKSTDATTIATNTKASTKEAQVASARGNKIFLLIVTRVGTLGAADKQNQLTQAIIGANEGAAAAVIAKVGM